MSPELQILIPIIVGSIAVPLINAIKKFLNSSDPRINLGVSFGVSLLLSIFALVITGAFSGAPVTPSMIVSWVGLIFTVATLIYKGTQTIPPQVK